MNPSGVEVDQGLPELSPKAIFQQDEFTIRNLPGIRSVRSDSEFIVIFIGGFCLKKENHAAYQGMSDRLKKSRLRVPDNRPTSNEGATFAGDERLKS
jgi:hypothetical protein